MPTLPAVLGVTGVTTGPGALTSEVTIVPADDPARASWFLGARLNALPVGDVTELRDVVDQRLSGTQARVARAETDLARQLAAELEGHDEAVDAALIEQAAAIRLGASLPHDAELRVDRLRQQTQELRAASSLTAEADGAAAVAERRLEQLAPSAPLVTDVELLREASQDVGVAEAAAQAAQADLGTAAKSVRPEQRIELGAAGKRAYQADLRLKQARRETRPLVAAAIALVVVAVAVLGAGAAGAVTAPAAGGLSGLLVLLGLGALVQRRAVVRPARLACVGAENTARELSAELGKREEEFGDWSVRVMQSMAADDRLRAALQRWEAVGGHEVDPDQVEHLATAVSAVEEARALRRRAADEQAQCQERWLVTALSLGITAEPVPEPGPTLELAEAALALRSVTTDRSRELHESERRLAARMRLTDLLRGRALDQLDHDAVVLTAAAGDGGDADGPLLYVDQEMIGPDERLDLLQEVRRLGPEGRFVVVTREPTEWNVAHMALRRSLDDDDRDPAREVEIDLRDDAATSTSGGAPRSITDKRPWFAS